jgi:hypothetical protein
MLNNITDRFLKYILGEWDGVDVNGCVYETLEIAGFVPINLHLSMGGA